MPNLVLARRYGERIVITTPAGERIHLTLLKRGSGHVAVNVAIAAPPACHIRRAEVPERDASEPHDAA